VRERNKDWSEGKSRRVKETTEGPQFSFAREDRRCTRGISLKKALLEGGLNLVIGKKKASDPSNAQSLTQKTTKKWVKNSQKQKRRGARKGKVANLSQVIGFFNVRSVVWTNEY